MILARKYAYAHLLAYKPLVNVLLIIQRTPIVLIKANPQVDFSAGGFADLYEKSDRRLLCVPTAVFIFVGKRIIFVYRCFYVPK